MFDINLWQEIIFTIKKNKLRTFLTGFSVAWGIFMLIILLGAGNGLTNGVRQQFETDATNAMYLNPGRTTKAYKGFQPGRRIQFHNDDLGFLKTQFNQLEDISGRVYMSGGRPVITYGENYGTFEISGCHPDYENIEKIIIKEGRFINDLDILKSRKVIAIGEPVKEKLFKDENPLGKYVKVKSTMYQVVGVFEDLNDYENRRTYIPFSTLQDIYNRYNIVHNISITLSDMTLSESEELENRMRASIARKHQFDVEDRSGVYIYNRFEDFSRTMKLFAGIQAFIWIIGIGTIIAGVVGVSNIMLITVKERTVEFGIRKALGATPFSVISMVILEAILITGIAGYIGLFAGVGVLETISYILETQVYEGMNRADIIFRNPTVNIGLAIAATVLLVILGTLAGVFPARKAALIKPVEALRYE